MPGRAGSRGASNSAMILRYLQCPRSETVTNFVAGRYSVLGGNA
jgi:hypothetical protein